MCNNCYHTQLVKLELCFSKLLNKMLCSEIMVWLSFLAYSLTFQDTSCMHVHAPITLHVHLHNYCIVGCFQGVYILRISGHENFCEDCTCEVTTLGTWVWFSIIFTKINSTNRSNFEINFAKYTPLENNPLCGIINIACQRLYFSVFHSQIPSIFSL